MDQDFPPSFVVVINNKSIKVYKTINSNSNNIYNKKNILNFNNYVSLKKKSKIIVNKKEIFFLPKFYKIFIGYDVNPENIYIVLHRKKLWGYIKELKEDNYLRQFIIFD